MNAPPLAADEDRHGHQRLDRLLLEEPPLVGRQVVHLAREQLVASAELGDPRQPDLLEAHVLHDWIGELGSDRLPQPTRTAGLR